jgi:hypothetical protein
VNILFWKASQPTPKWSKERGNFKSVAEYRKKTSELLDIVAGWKWNDPVSNICRDLFKGSTIVEPMFDREELLAELKYRQEHRIPPGFKDANHEYSGVGDRSFGKLFSTSASRNLGP